MQNKHLIKIKISILIQLKVNKMKVKYKVKNNVTIVKNLMTSIIEKLYSQMNKINKYLRKMKNLKMKLFHKYKKKRMIMKLM